MSYKDFFRYENTVWDVDIIDSRWCLKGINIIFWKHVHSPGSRFPGLQDPTGESTWPPAVAACLHRGFLEMHTEIMQGTGGSWEA